MEETELAELEWLELCKGSKYELELLNCIELVQLLYKSKILNTFTIKGVIYSIYLSGYNNKQMLFILSSGNYSWSNDLSNLNLNGLRKSLCSNLLR